MKMLLTTIFLIILTALGLRWYAAQQDDKINGVVLAKPYEIEESLQKEFDELEFIADLHCDALLWNRDITSEYKRGHVDIPRLRKGNIALQAFTIVTKSPKGQNVHENSGDSDRLTLLAIAQWQPFKTWFNLYERAVYQCKKLAKAAKNDDNFRIVKTQTDLSDFIKDRKNNKNLTAGYLGVEGMHCLEGNIDNVQKLYDAGVRMMAATHFFDNEMGGSAHGTSHEGLSDFGKQVISEMDRLGIIIDVAHISPEMFDDIAEHTNGVMMDSHTGVRAICDTPRNLSDKQIKEIARRGGVIGVGYFDLALCSTEISDIVNTMDYIKDLVGVEYVALGSDFDGAVTTPFDATGINLLYQALRNDGFTQEECKLIMGENVHRMLMEHLPT